LLSIDGITSVFYGPEFITVTKAPDAHWAHLKPQVYSLISEAFDSSEEIVQVTKKHPSAPRNDESPASVACSESDNEVVGLIQELLNTRIRPAIQDDGGDIEFKAFKDGNVHLKLRGACRTCDSSTITLRNGIENMLKHYVRFTSRTQKAKS
jgi:Fe-S cluster biogenesis protein NfuA